MNATQKPKLELVIHEGGHKELGQRMLRAFLEFRRDDARAMMRRLAYRATLRLVEKADSLCDGLASGNEHKPASRS